MEKNWRIKKLALTKYNQPGDRGATLGLTPSESGENDKFVISYSDRGRECNLHDLRNILENFIDFALKARADIDESYSYSKKKIIDFDEACHNIPLLNFKSCFRS